MTPRPATSDRTHRLIRAEAALWVTRLHGPGRDSRLETGFRRWLNDDPRHAAAFELATDAWLISADIAGVPTFLRPIRRNTPRGLVRSALAAAALVCCLVLALLYFLRDTALVTGPGEQKTLTLSDGTEITLNANSRVLMQYDEHLRKVVLVAGEALFNVKKHQSRPFAVIIGDRKVVALGTSFLVRRDDPTASTFAVTLIEGRVAIEPLSLPDAISLIPPPGVKLLNPGQRLRIQNDAERIDVPSIAKLTAWQRGQLIFDDASLSEAAAEFNRYGRDKITLAGAEVGRIRVGGVYRIGDPATFAQVIAGAHHLRVLHSGHEILMSGESTDARSER